METPISSHGEIVYGAGTAVSVVQQLYGGVSQTAVPRPKPKLDFIPKLGTWGPSISHYWYGYEKHGKTVDFGSQFG